MPFANPLLIASCHAFWTIMAIFSLPLENPNDRFDTTYVAPFADFPVWPSGSVVLNVRVQIGLSENLTREKRQGSI